jgi:hypothetical protein
VVWEGWHREVSPYPDLRPFPDIRLAVEIEASTTRYAISGITIVRHFAAVAKGGWTKLSIGAQKGPRIGAQKVRRRPPAKPRVSPVAGGRGACRRCRKIRKFAGRSESSKTGWRWRVERSSYRSLPTSRGKSSAVARSYNQMPSDIEVCYTMISRDVLRELKLTSDDFGFEIEISAQIARAKRWRIYEVGISYYGRIYHEGKKINWRDGLKALVYLVKFRIP